MSTILNLHNNRHQIGYYLHDNQTIHNSYINTNLQMLPSYHMDKQISDNFQYSQHDLEQILAAYNNMHTF